LCKFNEKSQLFQHIAAITDTSKMWYRIAKNSSSQILFLEHIGLLFEQCDSGLAVVSFVVYHHKRHFRGEWENLEFLGFLKEGATVKHCTLM